MATKRNFNSVALEASHSSASVLHRVDAISDKAMREAELGHFGVSEDGAALGTNNDVSKTKHRSNSRNGSSFDELLKGEGIFYEVHAKALGRALAEAAGENEKPSACGEVKV